MKFFFSLILSIKYYIIELIFCLLQERSHYELKSNNIHEKMNQYSGAGLSLAVIRDGKLDEAIAFGTLESEQLER